MSWHYLLESAEESSVGCCADSPPFAPLETHKFLQWQEQHGKFLVSEEGAWT